MADAPGKENTAGGHGAGITDGEDWVSRLAQALEQVDRAQGHNLHLRPALEREAEREGLPRPEDWPDVNFSFVSGTYRQLCYRDGFAGPQDGPLCAALHEAVDILGEHPTLEPFGADGGVTVLGGPEGPSHPPAIRMFDRDFETSRPMIVAGLLCRAMQVGGYGYKTAAEELLTLLDGADDNFGSLSAGYRVSVFCGLKLGGDEEVDIAGNLKLVPLARAEAVLDMATLRAYGPQPKDWDGVSAIVETVPWKPTAVERREGAPQGVDSLDQFYLDQRDLIALLSVCHGAPMAGMVVAANQAHRTASLLLGMPEQAGAPSMSFPRGRAGVDIRPLKDLDAEAFETVRRLYSNRERCREYRIAISRLSRALMRIGDYSDEDSILDAAIALERMYEPGRGEITYKLKMRAACFLASDMQARKGVFDKVNRFYKARSDIVHGSRKELSTETLREAFEAGFEVARETLIKLLDRGRPCDWDEIVLAGHGDTEPADQR